MGRRTNVVVRQAGPDDGAALLDLWFELVSASRGVGAHPRSAGTPSLESARQHIDALSIDPDRALFVAEVDGQVAGVVHASADRLTPLHPATAVRLSYLHVFESFRRRGVGHQLLLTATEWAATHGAEHIIVDSHPGQRDTQRFLARVGLSPLCTQRSAPVVTLMRRLGSDLGAATASVSPLADVGARRLRHRLALRPRRVDALSLTNEADEQALLPEVAAAQPPATVDDSAAATTNNSSLPMGLTGLQAAAGR